MDLRKCDAYLGRSHKFRRLRPLCRFGYGVVIVDPPLSVLCLVPQALRPWYSVHFERGIEQLTARNLAPRARGQLMRLVAMSLQRGREAESWWLKFPSLRPKPI